MFCHIALVLPRMSYECQRWTRSASTPRLAWIKEHVLPWFVCQLMGYLGRKQASSSFIVCVNFYVLIGNDLLDQWWAGFELDFHLPSCGLLYYVCVDYTQSGGVWVLLMAPLCPFCPMTNWLIRFLCVCISLLVFYLFFLFFVYSNPVVIPCPYVVLCTLNTCNNK